MFYIFGISRKRKRLSIYLALLTAMSWVSTHPAAATEANMNPPDSLERQDNISYLSNLHATANDPLFATYAAPIRRSEYIVDEGYRFRFYNPDQPIYFDTDHAGSMGIGIRKGDKYRWKLKQMARKPVVTTSYGDLVRYNYRPFDHLEVEVFFQVYSSHLAIQQVTVHNKGSQKVSVVLAPYLVLPKITGSIKRIPDGNAFHFVHRQPPDGWTRRKHDVPHQTERRNIYTIREKTKEMGRFRTVAEFHNRMQSGKAFKNYPDSATRVIAFKKSWKLQPGEQKSLRIVRGVRDVNEPISALKDTIRSVMDYNMNRAIRYNKRLYKSIPELSFNSSEKRLMYWSAFNLLRQCMLPPEAKTSYNYYVYSREPTWGWGHAGQVFHESLSMLAYVYMDPESAEDSQRLYMERQWDNGYIEYRAGPYLDAMNYVNGEFTSSAPWFNYINWEIFEVSRDTSFLRDAYRSGAKFYRWWERNRDKDDDGLAEWGGHAVLESVRDAQVAVWKHVGWPANFEAPELNAMLVKEARSLARMAEVLGKTAAAERWKEKAKKRSDLIKKTFWHEKSRFFYYVDKEDHDFTFKKEKDLLRQSIIGFIPLWAGTATNKQVEQLVEVMTNRDKFWRPYGIPSLAADDPFYNPTGYWNGPVWVEWQYLIMNGLLNHGYKDKARQLSNRVFENVIYHLKDSHTFWEFYSPEKKWAGHHQTYIWAGLVARMLMELKGVAEP